MGKYTLLIVLSAVLGGSLLTYNMRAAAGLTGRDRAEAQASLLARQIAESGQGVALATAVGDEGFLSPAEFFGAFGTEPQAYNGGFYQADSFRSFDGGRRAELVVSGRYGRPTPSRHVLTSTYEFDPMDYPGPVWLDVPYATTSGSGATKVNGAASVAGVSVTLPTHVDQTKFNALEGLLSLATMRSSVESAVSGTAVKFSNALKNTAKDPALGVGKLLDDLNVDNAEDLYQTVIGEVDGSDRTLAASTPGATYTVSSSQTWDGETTITHVDGPLRITSGGSVTGEGVLAVSGDLVVDAGGRLTWDGLVVVRSSEDEMRVTLQGTTRIRGGLVVTQEAAPQVGHMDVTVNKDPSGMWSPATGLTSTYAGLIPGAPFYSHSHKYDDHPSVVLPDGSRRIRFVDPSASSRTMIDTLAFESTIAALGGDDIQLRFINTDRHGHGFFRLRVDGEPLQEGTVRGGFGETFAAASASHTTKPFAADDLEALTLDIRSLPSLRRLFETESTGCDGRIGEWKGGWPICLGRTRDRHGALVLQVLHGGKVVYEASTYWHVNEGDEWAAHEAALAAWRLDVVNNGSFGATLDLSKADVTIDIPKIVRLADRLGFVGNRVMQLSSSVQHIAASEARATPASPTAPNPNDWIEVCHPPHGPNTSYYTEEVKRSQLSNYQANTPGALEGSCASNGL